MEAFYSTKGLDRFYEYSPSKEYLQELMDSYKLHEIIEEDILESSVQDKIDMYDNCMFLVLHFPKYRPDVKKYLVNEFNIIAGKGWLVTLTKYKTNRFETIKKSYAHEISEASKKEKFKLSPYYIIYELIDEMYDKVLEGLRKFTIDLRSLEEDVYETYGMKKEVLENIMLKRRNISLVKHMLKPQEEILQELQKDADVMNFWGEELGVYFEDLEYKLEKIMGQINIISEEVVSLYNSYNAMVSVKTNSIVTILTIFTAIIGLLTLVTGLYGMNIPIPGADSPYAISYILTAMSMIILGMLLFFRYKKWL